MADDGGRVPMSPGLQATLLRAREYAAGQSQAQVLLEHLLLALSEDADAAHVLEACRIDLGRLRNDVAGYLGSLNDRVAPGTPGAPAISQSLTQVLRYATLAAQQGRRSSIDGAIVLAALVGDGRSMAANFLKAQGLTFDAAIQALRDAATRGNDPAQTSAHVETEPNSHVDPAFATTTRAEDILARARERVETRSQPRPEFMDQRVETSTAPIGSPAPAAPLSTTDSEPQTERMPPLDVAEWAVDQSPPMREPPAAPPPRDEGQSRFDPAPLAATTPASPAAPRSAGMPADPLAAPRDASPPAVEPVAPPRDDIAAPQPGTIASPPHRPPGSSGGNSGQPAPKMTSDPNHRQPASDAPELDRPPVPAGWAPPPMRPSTPPQQAARAPVVGAQGRAVPPLPPGPPPRPPEPFPVWQVDPDPPATPVQPARPPMHADPHAGSSGAGYSHPAFVPPHGEHGQGGPTGRRPAVDATQVTHSIPRRLRQGRPHVIEVWIERPPIAGTANSRSFALRAENVVARAIAVRLRPLSGKFVIDAASPETQWDQSGAAGSNRLASEAAVWRFTVTPLRSGRGVLQLAISARTLGADGVLAETQLPDYSQDLRVAPSYGRIFRRILMALVTAITGMVLIKLVEVEFGVDFYYLVRQLLRSHT